MRIFTLRKSVILLFSAALLGVSSCVDDSIDLNNMSGDMALARSLALPLGETNMSIKNLLYHYDPASDTDITIDSTGTDGVVTLLYDKTIEYEAPTDLRDLAGFGSYETEDLLLGGTNEMLFQDFTAATPADQTYIDQIQSTGISLSQGVNFSCEARPVYDFDVNDEPDKQIINRVEFKNSSIVVTVKSNVNIPAGMLIADIEMPIEDASGNPVLIRDFPVELNRPTPIGPRDFTVQLNNNETSEVPIKLTFVGQNGGPVLNQSSYINIEVNFHEEGAQFVAYGKFFDREPNDYSADKKIIPIRLRDYLPGGTEVYPISPEIGLDIASNIGIPVGIKVKSLRTEELSQSDPTIVDKAFNAIFEDGSPDTTLLANRPRRYGNIERTSIALNNQPGNGEIDKLFGNKENPINVDRLYFDIDFGVKEDGTEDEQFISSDSKVSIGFKAKIPIHFRGHIAYADTIKDIDLSQTLKTSKEASLHLDVQNSLPLGVELGLILLDENQQPIVLPVGKNYLFDIQAAEVDADGAVAGAAKQQTIYIKYDSSTIDYLRKTKHLCLTFKAKGYTDTSKIKLRMRDFIKVKASVSATGGINF